MRIAKNNVHIYKLFENLYSNTYMQQNTAMNLCTDMLQPAIVKQSGEDANHTTRTISYNVTNATYEIDHPKLEQDKKPLLYRLVQDSGRLTILQKVKIALFFSMH